MSLALTQIQRLENGVALTWADGVRQTIPSEKLRLQCPCAGCREARGDTTHAKPLTGKKSSLKIISASKEEETKLKSLWAVGNYAVGLEWSDGHNSGIYTYEYLRELAQ